MKPFLSALWVAGLLLAGCSQKESYEIYTYQWNEAEGYSWASLPEITAAKTGFTTVSPEWSGIDFVNSLTDDQIAWNRNLLNGSGVAAGDVTGNGYPDLYFCRLDGPNVLYENLGGMKFRDITEKSGMALPDQFSTGALMADMNGNGRLDIIVTASGSPNKLFLNQGEGVFTDSGQDLSAGQTWGSTSAAIGDLTGNGAPDLYITNFKHRSVRDLYWNENTMQHIVEHLGDNEFRVRPKFEGHYQLDIRDDTLIWFELGEPDLLFFNDGDGNLTHIPLDSGVFSDTDGEPVQELYPDWGLDVRLFDLSGNGLTDIYVANDFESPDRIWLNQGDGSFRALPDLAIRKSSLSAMAIDFSDINRNGLTDFFVVEMLSRSHEMRQRQMSTLAPSRQQAGVYDDRPQFLGNTLYLNRGDTTWAEISEYAGVRRSEWSWSTLFMDVNLNGYEDILITNGHYFDVQDTDANTAIGVLLSRGRLSGERYMLEYPRLLNENIAFRNNGDLTFTDVSKEWGFASLDISHGMAFADLNNDGYQDIIINRVDEPAVLLKNTSGANRLAVRLKGKAPNTSGIGAKIFVEGGPVSQHKEISSGISYVSSSDYAATFAAGNADRLHIRVEWPDGTQSVVNDALPNRIYEIDQAVSEPRPVVDVSREETEPLFRQETASSLSHRQLAYDDFERQPLLPMRLSRKGPHLSVLDADSGPVIITGSSPNDPEVQVQIHRTAGEQGLGPGSAQDISADFGAYESAAAAGWTDRQGRHHIITAYSNYRHDAEDAPAAVYTITDGGRTEVKQVIPGFGAVPGAVSLADYTGNGFPDLLITGSVIPGRYPVPASSKLYRNDGGTFVPDDANNARLESIGLIGSGMFSDLTGNGRPELLLAERWGTLRVFSPDDQLQYFEITEELGFDQYKGWWNSIATGDLTGNGRLDIVATNWGLNHLYASAEGGNPMIFYDDFTVTGNVSILEAYYDDEIGGIVPRRNFEMLSRNPPYVRNRARTFTRFAGMQLNDLTQESLSEYKMVTADSFEHMFFLQDENGQFQSRVLPPEAQFAPAFDIVIADFTGDGNEDVFLTQNFFAYIPETPRNDAGRGLLLKGDGTGALEAVAGQDSGILIYGEQRSAAAADFTGDGRLDLIAGQNGAETIILKNTGAEPGLAVHLQGPNENPQAIGAKVRMVNDDGRKGPVREIQAGSGYRSQSSLIPILGGSARAVSVEIRWPDGFTETAEIPAGARKITVTR